MMQGEEFFRNSFGVPQGGPISPFLSVNIYLHELDRTWVERGYEHRRGFDAKLVRYTDDSVNTNARRDRCRRSKSTSGAVPEMEVGPPEPLALLPRQRSTLHCTSVR